MQKKLMFSMLFPILILLLIFGCTSTKYDSQAPILNKTGQPTVTSNTYKINEPFTIKNLKYTVKSITTRMEVGNTYSSVQAKGQFLIFQIEIENVGSKPEDLYSLNFTIIDNNQRRFESENKFQFSLDPEFKDGESLNYSTLNPGLKQTSYLLFDVPLGLKGNLQVVDNITLPTKVAWVVWDAPQNNASNEPLSVEIMIADGTTFQRESEVQLPYKIHNAIHNGTYDIQTYEKLFFEDGNQLWPDYDMGRETGQKTEPIGIFVHFMPVIEKYPSGKYTFEVTIYDYKTDRNTTSSISFNLE